MSAYDSAVGESKQGRAVFHGASPRRKESHAEVYSDAFERTWIILGLLALQTISDTALSGLVSFSVCLEFLSVDEISESGITNLDEVSVWRGLFGIELKSPMP